MLNFFSSSYSVYENGVIFIQTSFICKFAENYISSLVSLIKNNENLKSLFFYNNGVNNGVTIIFLFNTFVFSLPTNNVE